MYAFDVAARKDTEFEDVGTAVMPPRSGQKLLGAVVRVVTSSAKPVEFHLKAGVCRVGSGAGNDIVIDDRTVSRRHADLTLTQDGVLLRDLESRNGTHYLGNKVGTIVLGLGARVSLGGVTLAIDPDTEALLDELQYDEPTYRGILGASPRMRKLFALLQRLEASVATVLIEGESGAGKEVVARAIHEGSPCASGKLVTINCGAIARELVASELFGHRRGAFTGAIEVRKGAFELADRGTLFLDEVAELPIDVQPALLRALELGEIRAVGQEESRVVKVRIIAATHRDLQAEVAAGRFRQDLFYRLAVVRIAVPPLRGRPEDVELLARHFAQAAGLPELSAQLLEELKARTWPGNARELRNALQSFAALGVLPEAPSIAAIEGALLEDAIDPTQPYAEQKEHFVERFTRAYLKALLRYANGNQAAAARIGKLDRTYLGRMMAKYGLR